MKKDGILGIGVATMDIYVNKGRMYPGGNEYNVVCNAKLLGNRAGFLGVFGSDKYAPILEGTLKELGVDVSMSHHEEGTSGYSHVELKDDGDRVFIDWNQEGVTDLYPIQFTDAEMQYINGFEVVELSIYSTVSIEKIRNLYEHGVEICYDFSDDYGDIKMIAPYCKYAFFSCSNMDINEIKETLKSAVDLGCSVAVSTRGVDSVIAYDGTRWYEQNTFPVDKVRDALGAGDSYIGAFLTHYLQTSDIQYSLMKAAEYAASVVMKEGSIGVGFDFLGD